jgi:uncharacterized cupin superfamily protein
MPDIAPNAVANAAAVSLAMAAVPDDQRVSGEPATGSAVLGTFADLEVGVWEMTTGVMRDIEADELFVVLSGSARVDFADGSVSLDLGPGDVVRLAAGTATQWTVHQPLRKVYLTPS